LKAEDADDFDYDDRDDDGGGGYFSRLKIW
jgi:hypothetical protein